MMTVGVARTLRRLQGAKLAIMRVDRPTPLSFPLMIERLGSEMSSQTLLERVERMKADWLGPEKPLRRKRWSWNRA